MKTDVLAMLLVGGRGSRLHPITKNTAKPAVTFGGKYKLIDFVLSNLSNAGITTVGIITQYEPHALMKYIEHGASWDLDIADGGVQFLTPYTSADGDHWQKGTAHAIRQHLHFVEQHDPDYVLILSGDHVYKMDYKPLIKAHADSGCDMTIAAFKPHDDLSRYGILMTDKDRVIGFEEKPARPKSELASMGIYVFNRNVLDKILAASLSEDFDFGKDIIPKALNEDYLLNSYTFDGYFRDVGTIESLYQANMDLIRNPEYLKLSDYKTLPLYTKSTAFPPHHIEKRQTINDSLISDGCLIQGHVKNSVLSPNVTVGFEADIEDSIIFADVTIGDRCRLKNVIVLENTVIMKGMEIVYDKVHVIDNETLWALGDKHE